MARIYREEDEELALSETDLNNLIKQYCEYGICDKTNNLMVALDLEDVLQSLINVLLMLYDPTLKNILSKSEQASDFFKDMRVFLRSNISAVQLLVKQKHANILNENDKGVLH